MPAGSEQPLPPLPVTYRPRGVRLATIGFGAALFLTVAVIWFAFPADIRAQFTPFQRLTVVGMGLGLLVMGHALARCRIEVREEGLTVVNGYRTHRLDWGHVVDASLRPGNPWVVLDLSDGTTVSALGIQGSDGRLAHRQARELRRLIEAHAGQEPG